MELVTSKAMEKKRYEAQSLRVAFAQSKLRLGGLKDLGLELESEVTFGRGEPLALSLPGCLL